MLMVGKDVRESHIATNTRVVSRVTTQKPSQMGDQEREQAEAREAARREQSRTDDSEEESRRLPACTDTEDREKLAALRIAELEQAIKEAKEATAVSEAFDWEHTTFRSIKCLIP
jgi:hypothetical protein